MRIRRTERFSLHSRQPVSAPKFVPSEVRAFRVGKIFRGSSENDEVGNTIWILKAIVNE